MFESKVGVNVAATRQNPGRLPKVPPSGAAAVIMASGKTSCAKLAHAAAAAGVAPTPTSEVSSAMEIRVAARCWPLNTHLIEALPVLELTRGDHSSRIPASRRPAK